MLKGARWLGVAVLSAFLFFTAVPFAHSETASCQKGGPGKMYECVDLSIDGELSGSECGIIKKFVRSSCPTDGVIATCTYEMGISSMVKTDTGFVPGTVKPLKHQVNCYSNKNGSDEQRLEICRARCRSLEGKFSKTVALQK